MKLVWIVLAVSGFACLADDLRTNAECLACAKKALWDTQLTQEQKLGPVTILNERERPTEIGDYTRAKGGGLIPALGKLKGKQDDEPVLFVQRDDRQEDGVEKGFHAYHDNKVYAFEIPKQQWNKGYVVRHFFRFEVGTPAKTFYVKYDTLPKKELEQEYYKTHPFVYPSIVHTPPSYYDLPKNPSSLRGHVEQRLIGSEVKGASADTVKGKIFTEVEKHLVAKLGAVRGAMESTFDDLSAPLSDKIEATDLPAIQESLRSQHAQLKRELKDFSTALEACAKGSVKSVTDTAAREKIVVDKLLEAAEQLKL